MAGKSKTGKSANAARKTDGKKAPAKRRGRFSVWRGFGRLFANRIFRSMVMIAIILAILPVIFMFIYAIPGTTPVSTLIMGRAVLAKPVERIWVDLDDIAAVVPQSVIMSEDGQFCFHRGIDWRELNAVIDDALEGEKTRGASTLPMQTVKNLFLWPHRSFIRKIAEMPYAIIADMVWSKRRIMEIYLNIAEFDEGVFGIGAASRHYFNRSASRLTRRQAALLAVTLPNPKARNPARPSRSLNRLARRIERLSAKSGAYVKCLK